MQPTCLGQSLQRLTRGMAAALLSEQSDQLEAGKTYVIWINPDRFQGLRRYRRQSCAVLSAGVRDEAVRIGTGSIRVTALLLARRASERIVMPAKSSDLTPSRNDYRVKNKLGRQPGPLACASG
ncbi:hypothetical protein BH10PLA2_BH10PLA2_07100 [soil metagenome]